MGPQVIKASWEPLLKWTCCLFPYFCVRYSIYCYKWWILLLTIDADCTAFSVSNFISGPGSLWHQTGQAALAVNTAALSICSTSFLFRRGSQSEKRFQWGERVPNWSSQLCSLNLFFFFEWFKDTRENVLLVSFAFLGTAVREVLIF